MSFIQCCCGATNPCSCTYPKTVHLTFFSASGPGSPIIWPYGLGSIPPDPTPNCDLVWGTRPTAFPAAMNAKCFNGTTTPIYTLPAEGWWGPPITGRVGRTMYLYGYVVSCIFTPGIVALKPDFDSDWHFAPNLGHGAPQHVTCTPFYGENAHVSGPTYWQYTGTHGSDDIVPDSVGSAGAYT